MKGFKVRKAERQKLESLKALKADKVKPPRAIARGGFFVGRVWGGRQKAKRKSRRRHSSTPTIAWHFLLYMVWCILARTTRTTKKNKSSPTVDDSADSADNEDDEEK